MPFAHHQFDAPDTRTIDRSSLRWPDPDEAGTEGEDSGFGGNRHYSDMRGVNWDEVLDVLSTEEEFVQRIENAANADDEAELIEAEREQILDDGDADALWGLDLGVAAATLALSAARCVPFTSCNAGAFNTGHHPEAHPVVGVMVREEMVDAMIDAATASGVGLYQHSGGEIAVCAPNVPSMMAFARALHDRRAEIDAIEVSAD